MAVSIVCLAAGLATAARAQAPSRSMLQHTSWGKAGMSLEEYRADASARAREAVNLDVSGTEAAKTLVAASRAIDTAYSSAWRTAPGAGLSFPGALSGGGSGIWGGGGHDVQQLIHAYWIDEQFHDIAALQYRALDTCLSARG